MIKQILCPDCGRTMNHLKDESWSCPCGYRIVLEPETEEQYRDRLTCRAESVPDDQKPLFEVD